MINEKKNTIIIILSFIGILILLFLFWYFGAFTANNVEQHTENNIIKTIEKKPLTLIEQKKILKKLAPEKELTDSEKKEQIEILNNLQNNQDEKKDSIDLLNSLNNTDQEEEQLKLLESLKN